MCIQSLRLQQAADANSATQIALLPKGKARRFRDSSPTMTNHEHFPCVSRSNFTRYCDQKDKEWPEKSNRSLSLHRTIVSNPG